jgi:GNAT superfamily N-acetyltransferase
MLLSGPQVEAAGRLLARAFFDDPGAAIIEPDASRRAAVNRVLFELDIASALGAAWACLDAGRLAGVAVWIAPDAAPEDLDDRRLSRARSAIGDAAVDRWAAMLVEFERARREAIEEPHWFLALLGTDPDRQGRGVGAALLQIGHEAADRDGRPCFLETFTEANVDYYQRRGYQLIRSTTVAGQIPLHAMSRPPRSAS